MKTKIDWGVDDNIIDYGCDGWTNCVDEGLITWNWPKPLCRR